MTWSISKVLLSSAEDIHLCFIPRAYVKPFEWRAVLRAPEELEYRTFFEQYYDKYFDTGVMSILSFPIHSSRRPAGGGSACRWRATNHGAEPAESAVFSGLVVSCMLCPRRGFSPRPCVPNGLALSLAFSRRECGSFLVARSTSPDVAYSVNV